jgi:hypothetical protein
MKIGKNEAGLRLRDFAEGVGEEAILLAEILTVEIEQVYLDEKSVTTDEVLLIERKVCELCIALAI